MILSLILFYQSSWSHILGVDSVDFLTIGRWIYTKIHASSLLLIRVSYLGWASSSSLSLFFFGSRGVVWVCGGGGAVEV